MIEQINENVFRVKRSDLAYNTAEVFEEIQKIIQCDASYLTARKRDDANINGSLALIENIENDYRSTCFVIVQYPEVYPVTYNSHEFKVLLDRYSHIISVYESEHGIEMLTSLKVYPSILKQYAQDYKVKVDFGNYMKVDANPD